MKNRDTVEEYWDLQVLQSLLPKAAHVTGNQSFSRALLEYLESSGTLHLFTGARFALESYLNAVKSKERHTVLISSFNCPVVAEAVERAGLKVETFDLASPCGGFDWELLAKRFSRQILAVVIPHLFGVPVDLRPILHPARASGVLVIEDCAHTLGGRIGGKIAGNWGNAAIFSFNYDKPISLGGGGALLINDGQPAAITDSALCNYPIQEEAAELALFLDYLADRRARINKVGYLNRISERILSKIGRRNILPEAQGFGTLRALLGIWQLERYPEILAIRNQNADRYISAGLRTWQVEPEITPAYLKQKALPVSTWDVKALSKSLKRRGLRVGAFNWPTIISDSLPELQRPNATFAATHGLDLPVHGNMTDMETTDIINTLRLSDRL
ncbi:MAG: DegT/DnrJ/EryC1/StrS family aminotransferase [Pseudomonadales bacterium]|nr:DegT/DnrJ/EryC1/StrS family aminotransferase [Pseudomonadales bacterium]